MKQLMFLGLMLLGTLTYAQSNKPVTVNLTVEGTCEMCKERIERTVDVKGVKYFEYTLASHNLEITYVPSKITEEQILEVFNLNFVSVVKAIQYFHSRLKNEGSGHIVNISSVGGVTGSVKFPGLSMYSSSKGALSRLYI